MVTCEQDAIWCHLLSTRKPLKLTN
uniref:Uncharacterized protein n=1 Tax=Rhizophora mucronata TaxID=61149 RepID=A0A2P2QJ05_RHIMU